jgi:hypothetical protein
MTKTKVIHLYSLSIGVAFRVSYWAFGGDNEVTQYLLDKYRRTRRKIPGQTRGPDGHSTRYGAYDAYCSTQDR